MRPSSRGSEPAANGTTHPIYRGSSKHKNRPAEGAKGTLCPEWTHRTDAVGLRTDMHAHDWLATHASTLFAEARIDPQSGRRFATQNGIAFEAKPTADGTWHGYPVPWESVPPDIKDAWIDLGMVTRKQLRVFKRFEKTDIHWALTTDEG